MRNPLIKRIPRELISDWHKYAVIFVFLTFTIGFVSGMFVANGSMMKAADEAVVTFNRENGHFELDKKASGELIAGIETGDYPEGMTVLREDDFHPVPVRISELFYRDEQENENCTIRLYKIRNSVDLPDMLEGRLPETPDEIAIDRMHADNAGILVNDTLEVSGMQYSVTGLFAVPDYSTLFRKNTDTMFDALTFDIGLVTEAGFTRTGAELHYVYAWKYIREPADENEEKELSDDFLKCLNAQALSHDNEIEDYIPAYLNQAIKFARDDMGGDVTMGAYILYVLVGVMAFIFAITISNTIISEAPVIGTLMASGYSRRELTVHYMTLPVLVTLAAGALGNVLGYTVFKNIVVGMYYNSYSLPGYETVLNSEAFVKTTVVPLTVMFIVNLTVILRLFKNKPLRFLRRNLKTGGSGRAVKLPDIAFIHRFRLRVLLQNMPNYMVLLSGFSFIMLMLALAIGLPETLSNYQKNAKDMMLVKYQMILKSTVTDEGKPVRTAVPEAEKAAVTTLDHVHGGKSEDITVYGIRDGSRYVKMRGVNKSGEVLISTAYSGKYGLEPGDTFELKEKYEDKHYRFRVKGLLDYDGGLSVFMPMKYYADWFSTDRHYYNSFLCDRRITDVDEDYVGKEISADDITKMADQLDHSMGDYMKYFQVLCVILSASLTYLLTKLIIEKNEGAISMIKILGFSNGEISSLYLFTTSAVAVAASVIGAGVGYLVIGQVWKAMMMGYEGWFTFFMSPLGILKMIGFVLGGYLVVMLLDYRRIRKIPLSIALKNVE